ncbi:LuxR C-terminal-related transcriptional regulator, partial [Vibrio sp. V39_P1S14PM300]
MLGNGKAQVTLLSDVSMQSNLFKDSLESHLNMSVSVVPFATFSDAPHPDTIFSEVVLIDFSYLDDKKFEVYTQIKSRLDYELKEIVINCPKDIPSVDLFKWRNLVGVFYLDDDLKLLIKGMEKILEGEMWLSRKLAQDYIHHFRSSNAVTTSQTYANLTKREKEIIRLLGQGASNIQIADELFVSENTVKTHLHNIFKKINAKNRLQALLWANNNIGIEERVE